MPSSSTDALAHRTLAAAALERWRRWAASLADGGPQPAPLELLEAGAVLGLREPMAALEDDAQAIAAARQLVEKLVGPVPQALAVVQMVGGVDEIRRAHPRAFPAGPQAGQRRP